MNLHRTENHGQWETLAPEQRNLFQKVAAKTGGIVTPGNAVSAIGAGLVGSGLKDVAQGEKTKGLVKIGVGRMADIGDGMAAEASGTKSPIGEAVDVVVDKTETIAAMPILVNADILPKSAAGVIIGLNAGTAAFSSVAKRRGITVHPSREGKLAMAGQWGVVGLFGLSEIAKGADSPKLARGLEAAATLGLVATAALGAKAILGYAQESLGPIPEQNAAHDSTK